MAEQDKPKNILEGFEVVTGNLIRRPFKRFLRRRLDLLKTSDQAAWLGATWIHKRQPDKAETFRNLMLAGFTAAEFFADWLAARTGFIGQAVNTVVEQIMEDLPFTIREYFEEQPDNVFPTDYTGPAPGDFDRLAGRLNAFLKDGLTTFRSWIRGGFVKDFFEFRQGFLVAKATTELGPEAMIEFSEWYMSLPPRIRQEIQPALRAINEVGEMGRLLLLDPGLGYRPGRIPVMQPGSTTVLLAINKFGDTKAIPKEDPERVRWVEESDQRLQWLRSINSMNELHFPLTRRQRRQVRVLWKRYFSTPLTETTAWLKQKNDRLDPTRASRTETWKDRFYDSVSLKKDPFLANLLDPRDPRRQEYERGQATKRRAFSVLIAIGGVAALAYASGYIWWFVGAIVLLAASASFSIYLQRRRLSG